MDIQSMTVVVLGMAGFGALVSAIVGMLKSAGVIQDGQAQVWVTGFNLLGVIFIYVFQALGMQLDIVALDANLNTVATILVAMGQLVVSMGGSKLFYQVTKGTPVLGKSFS